jgi:hypothetical protein
MFSIIWKMFGMTLLAALGVFAYRFPEQLVVLFVGIGLTVFAAMMRRRKRQINEEIERTTT